MQYPKIRVEPLLTLCLLLLFSTVRNSAANSPAGEIPEGIFGYRETVGDQVTPFSWKAEELEGDVVITVDEKGKSFSNLCSADGATREWRIQEDGRHDLTAVREGNILDIRGIRFGEQYHERVEIDDRPWYQPLSYSLGSFLDSAAARTSFWVIRADKIEVIALTAEKLGREILQIEGKSVPARKVEVRAEGFFAKFWFATYWFREGDNLFLRYQSVHGLPGTEETVVELTHSPGERRDS